MSEPRTETGKRLLAALVGDVHDTRDPLEAILDIEQEAFDAGLVAAFEDVQRIDRAEAVHRHDAWREDDSGEQGRKVLPL